MTGTTVSITGVNQLVGVDESLGVDTDGVEDSLGVEVTVPMVGYSRGPTELVVGVVEGIYIYIKIVLGTINMNKLLG